MAIKEEDPSQTNSHPNVRSNKAQGLAPGTGLADVAPSAPADPEGEDALQSSATWKMPRGTQDIEVLLSSHEIPFSPSPGRTDASLGPLPGRRDSLAHV